MAPMRRPATDDRDDTFTLPALARRLHVKSRDIRRLLGTGSIPFVEVRGRIRVPRDAISLLERNLPTAR